MSPVAVPVAVRRGRTNLLKPLMSRFCVAVPVAVRRGSGKCLK